MGQKFKIDLLLLPKWMFFQLNFVAKVLKSDIVFLRYSSFITEKKKIAEKLILRRKLLKYGDLGKIITNYTNWNNFYMKIPFLCEIFEVT